MADVDVLGRSARP